MEDLETRPFLQALIQGEEVSVLVVGVGEHGSKLDVHVGRKPIAGLQNFHNSHQRRRPQSPILYLLLQECFFPQQVLQVSVERDILRPVMRQEYPDLLFLFPVRLWVLLLHAVYPAEQLHPKRLKLLQMIS